jgi:outer membrane receptor protein involved in Fe transport
LSADSAAREFYKTMISTVVVLMLGCWVPHSQQAVADQTQQVAPAISEASPSTGNDSQTQRLETIVVTGSLIPQSQGELAQPLTIITSEEMQSRGFSTVAEALQQSSFATGSVGGPQSTNGFTPGALTLSMFGLDPSFTKYLIDGRPMSDYPELYNATDVIVSITGVPQALVDHIDVLPGGASSLYGSDAIAGVVNIVLKKQLDAPLVDVRYGAYQDGGGIDRRIAFADSFKFGSVNLLGGVQYEDTDPIWGYQRKLTSSYYTAGSSPVTAEQDYVIYDYFRNQTYFLDPANCANVASQFGGTTQKFTQLGVGSWCGTTKAGFYTLNNGTRSIQGYLHATADVSEHLQFYGDALLSHDDTGVGNSAGYWGTAVNYGAIYDPRIGALINLQHVFSPEEAGGLDNTLAKIFTDSYRVTSGVQGSIGDSGWTYDASMTHMTEKLIRRNHVQFTDAISNFFAPVLGANLGLDPIYGQFPVFEPNYSAFYKPVTPAQYDSFSGYAFVHEDTAESIFRSQLTNASLFALPGGRAALAMAFEAADEEWNEVYDPSYSNGSIYEYIAVTGSGHRSRQAATAELRLPFARRLSASVSTRYDNYHVSGANVGKATYTGSLEFHPTESLLARARYGTAFKAPTLADEYQGPSGFYQAVTDYYSCAKQGYSGANIGECPEYLSYYQTSTSGNRNLRPITADVWDAGIVWTPVDQLSFSADVLQWAISNEVSAQSADTLLKTEALCRLGTYDVNSPTCLSALSQVIRDSVTGVLLSIYTPKVNVSHEADNAVISSMHYDISLGQEGRLAFQAAWSDVLKHTYQMYPQDPVLNELNSPIQSTDFKSKINGSLTWKIGDWASTIYVAWYGRAPNYLATVNGYGTPGAGTLLPWTVCNGSLRYQWTRAFGLAVAMDNLFDAKPPVDHSYPGSSNVPYNNDNYNVYGRSYFLEASYEVQP